MEINNRIKENLVIGTHNGIFHTDEVLGISILNLLYKDHRNIYVIRSRDIDYLRNNCNILVDIGGGKFDHHQKGGNGERPNGVKYASSGLVWKEFGELLINKLSNCSLSLDEVNKVFKIIDENIIEQIDNEDNGELNDSHLFQYTSVFLPNWNDEEKDYDKAFEKCARITADILESEIKRNISMVLAEKYINNKVENLEGNVIEIPSQTFPWQTLITNLNEMGNDIDFVVFKYPAGGYALQCVPKSCKDLFSQRVSLPENWAGETNNLPEISGVKSATFCHNGRFFARANKRDDIFKMCDIATKEYKKENVKVKKRKHA